MNIIESIIDFVTDIFLLRTYRKNRNKSARSVYEDGQAYVSWWVVTAIASIVAGTACFIFYKIGLPFWLSLTISLVALIVFAFWQAKKRMDI